jgi:hypothetical protein
VDINLTLPRLRTEDWRLRIHGMVDREVTLIWPDLVSRPLIERPVTMTCVSNEVGGPYNSPSNEDIPNTAQLCPIRNLQALNPSLWIAEVIQ